MRRSFLPAMIALLALAVALFVPVTAQFINEVDVDLIQYRTASCGPAIVAFLGGKPRLGTTPQSLIGPANAKTACQASAGRRVAGGLAALLALLAVTWAADRRLTNRTGATVRSSDQ